ncbi:MAG: hypothetical protein ACKVQT_05800 [Burkholderiales bacterium]
MRSVRWVKIVMVCLVPLAGCGTRYATMRGANGEDLMLLGNDPVAYFIVGKPTRGRAAIPITGATALPLCG